MLTMGRLFFYERIIANDFRTPLDPKEKINFWGFLSPFIDENPQKWPYLKKYRL